MNILSFILTKFIFYKGNWACNKCTETNKETDNTLPIESDKSSVEMDSDEVQQQEQENESKEETVEITDEIGTVKEQIVSGKESPIEPPKKISPVPMETNGVNERYLLSCYI